METENSKPQESMPATVPAAPVPTPAPVANTPAPSGPIPQTTGKTPGGWNRFAGYDREAAKNKKNDRRDGQRGRR